MASDQEIAKCLEAILRQSDPNSFTTFNGVVQQLEAKLGLDLSQKAGFIRDQINFLLRSHPPQPLPPRDHFALQHHPQFPNTQPQFHPHFALQPQQQPQQHQQHRPEYNLNFLNPFQPQLPQAKPPTQPQLRQPQVQPAQVVKTEANVQDVKPNVSDAPKESAPAKRKGGPGGLNKVCGVTPELQVIVGEPALPRTEIVKQLWAYIRKNNLQDPSNKRKIICDDALRVVFETDCTDMFKMNKLLSKHIIRLEPKQESGRAKKLKVEAESPTENTEPGSTPTPPPPPPLVIISEALANFFGTGEREVPQSEVLRRIWEYIKVNNLEDPLNSMVILCDAKLQQLLGCESISAFGIPEMLARHHLFKR